MADSLLDQFADDTTRQREFIEALRRALIKATRGCGLQSGADGKRWPCGTCTCSFLAGILPDTAAEYALHNEPVDRINELWRAILQIREFADRS
jgi:hypothetical protein